MDKLNYTELAKNVCSELAIPPDAQVVTILTRAFERVWGAAIEAAAYKVADWYGHDTTEQENGVEAELRTLTPSTISVHYGDPKDATVLTNPCEKKP